MHFIDVSNQTSRFKYLYLNLNICIFHYVHKLFKKKKKSDMFKLGKYL